MISTMSNEIFTENGSNHLSRIIRDESCKFALESTEGGRVRSKGEPWRDDEKGVTMVRRYVPELRE